MSNGDVRAELERLALEHDGKLTPDVVVAEANDPDSPLHRHFTWDDSEAAAKQRLHEARQLIRSVRVEVKTETLTIAAPMFVRDPTADGRQQGYVTVASLRPNEDLAREVIVTEFGRAAAALARARAVAAALGMAEQIKEVEGRVAHLSQVATQAAA